MSGLATTDGASEAQGPVSDDSVQNEGSVQHQETVTQPEPEISADASPTLEEIIAQRNAVRQGQEAEAAKPAPAPEPAPAPAEEVKPDDKATEDAEKQRIWDLYKTDPTKLIDSLKESVKPEPPTTEDDAPAPEEAKAFVAQEYTTEVINHANELYSSRDAITLGGIFGGADVLAELGIDDGDLSDALTDFVKKTMAPQLAELLAVSAYQKEAFEKTQKTLSPVLSNANDLQIAKLARAGIDKAFPEFGTDQAAHDHFHKTFAELAPSLYDRALLENPQSNPKEYAKILEGIAVLAARDFVKQAPAQVIDTKKAPPTPTSPALSPAPAPVAATYRNQLGQFSEKNPITLQAANDARGKALLEYFTA